MLNLYSRSVWPGALKYTSLSLLDAKNLLGVLHRWSSLSRLMQDKVYIQNTMVGSTARISLVPLKEHAVGNPFGIELTLKMIHGVTSWLTLAARPRPCAPPASCESGRRNDLHREDGQHLIQHESPAGVASDSQMNTQGGMRSDRQHSLRPQPHWPT
jgi:hypothetical protein